MESKKPYLASSKIWLHVPTFFLEQFDAITQEMFSSRNEAIRRGMNLVLNELKHYKNQSDGVSLYPIELEKNINVLPVSIGGRGIE